MENLAVGLPEKRVRAPDSANDKEDKGGENEYFRILAQTTDIASYLNSQSSLLRLPSLRIGFKEQEVTEGDFLRTKTLCQEL